MVINSGNSLSSILSFEEGGISNSDFDATIKDCMSRAHWLPNFLFYIETSVGILLQTGGKLFEFDWFRQAWLVVTALLTIYSPKRSLNDGENDEFGCAWFDDRKEAFFGSCK